MTIPDYKFLLLFSIIKKLERIGELVPNIAEEIIFFREAEVLKHKKKNGLRKKKDDDLRC